VVDSFVNLSYSSAPVARGLYFMPWMNRDGSPKKFLLLLFLFFFFGYKCSSKPVDHLHGISLLQEI
jgi:hypothetical protein